MSDASRPLRPQGSPPLAKEEGWLSLVDDELLFRIQSLARDHGEDEELLAVVRSNRHFFVRQEAAKRIRDTELLKAFASDRHIGQILVRHMSRDGDAAYLQELIRRSRHLEVRKAAQAELLRLEDELAAEE